MSSGPLNLKPTLGTLSTEPLDPTGRMTLPNVFMTLPNALMTLPNGS